MRDSRREKSVRRNVLCPDGAVPLEERICVHNSGTPLSCKVAGGTVAEVDRQGGVNRRNTQNYGDQ